LIVIVNTEKNKRIWEVIHLSWAQYTELSTWWTGGGVCRSTLHRHQRNCDTQCTFYYYISPLRFRVIRRRNRCCSSARWRDEPRYFAIPSRKLRHRPWLRVRKCDFVTVFIYLFLRYRWSCLYAYSVAAQATTMLIIILCQISNARRLLNGRHHTIIL